MDVTSNLCCSVLANNVVQHSAPFVQYDNSISSSTNSYHCLCSSIPAYNAALLFVHYHLYVHQSFVLLIFPLDHGFL